MLLTLNLDKDIVDKECIALTRMSAPKSLGIFRTKLYTPKTNRLVTDGDTSLGEQIFDITIAEVKSMVQPDRIADGIGGKLVAFVRRLGSFHSAIVA